MDHISYGHDIETAFLLMEAAHALEQEVEKTSDIAASITNHVLLYGFDKEKGGIYDAAYYFDDDDIPTLIQGNKTWWSQAEALNGFLYMHLLFPEKKEWKNAFYLQWEYIDQYLLDHYYGGWYSSGTDTAPHSTRRNKAHEWKTCYHTSRAMLNCIRLLRGESL
jgi:mannobiose 2-epimerase